MNHSPFFRHLATLLAALWLAGPSVLAAEPAAPKSDDPHLLLWLDAADAKTLTIDADGHVSAWLNKATCVNGKFETGGNQRPRYVEKALGGKPTLRFDGADDLLRNTQFSRSAKNWTLMIVVTPRSNRGNGQFHGIFSACRPKADDFVTGLNLDLGSSETADFSDLNLESSKDDPGVRSLRTEVSKFGEGQILTVVTDAALSKLYVGQEAENMRFAGDAENSLEEVRIGGRFFAGAEHGFLDGDISEVLFFDSALGDEQRVALAQYLAKKYDCSSKKIEYSLEDAWTMLAKYDGLSSRLPLTPIDQAMQRAHGNTAMQKNIERRLIAALQSDTTPAAKEFACRRLIFVATEDSIPALAKYLVDPKIGPLAQITLQAIPGEAATAALRDAVPKAPEKRQLGLIQGLGLRRDRKAVSLLAPLLDSPKDEVASAAALALGEIGDSECIAPLGAFLKKDVLARKTVAFGANLKLAFRLLEEDKRAESEQILKALEPLANEASRCAILASTIDSEPKNAASLLFHALSGKSPRIRGEAAQLLRMTKRSETVSELAKRFVELPPEGQILLLDAIAGREPKVVKPAVLEALKSNDSAVRVMALSLLGAFGAGSDVKFLVRAAAAAASDAERDAAFLSLTQLRGEGIDAALIGKLKHSDAAWRAVVVRALAARQSFAAFDELAKTANDPDPTVRAETGKALQILASERAVGRLIQLLLEASDSAQRNTFEQALTASCQKIADPQKRAEPVLQVYLRAEEPAREILLPTLGALGGPRASELIHAVLRDSQSKLYDAAVRALANWPDASVVPELLTMAKNAQQPLQRSWAVRGIARVAPRPGQMPPPEAFDALRQAFELADRPEDKKLVLTRMVAVRTPECLAFAAAKIDDDAFQTEAIAATVKLAEGMKESHPREAKSAFERVLAVTKDATLKTRIQRLLSKIKLPD